MHSGSQFLSLLDRIRSTGSRDQLVDNSKVLPLMDPIDKLLNQIKADQEGSTPTETTKQCPPVHRTPAQPSSPGSVEDLLAEVDAQRMVNAEAIAELPADPLLDQLRVEYAERDHTEDQKQHQKLQEEQRQQEQLKQQQQVVLVEQANTWLKQITPNSEEGLWFEEFAHNYSSRLEAAIEYLQAVKHSSSSKLQ